MPTFSFSPSLKLEKDCIIPSRAFDRDFDRDANESDVSDSPVTERIVFSAGSTPMGTPKRVPKGSASSPAASSPFHSLRGQRTPIGHQRGSVFKMLPPRLYPNSREETASCSENAHSYTSSPSPSPSPRMVPLTVLSRDGSPLTSPNKCDPSGMPSPLMRSLDLAKEESMADLLLSPRLDDVKMPNISAVHDYPLKSEISQMLLPRIKLTPRVKSMFVQAAGDGLAMPRLTSLRPKVEHTPASSFVTDCHGEDEAAEMDSLLNGFGHHQAVHDDGDPTEDHKKGSFDRVESEEAEIASLTQGPWKKPPHWHPSPAMAQDKNNRCSQSSFTCSDGDDSYLSDRKPMPSITLNLQGEEEGAPSKLCTTSPSFLPRPLPIAQNKSRSLFGSSNARDPLEGLLRADAIAEAARSNEPLTDDDSDIDGEDAGFLLCLPQDSQESESPIKSSNMCHVEEDFPLKSTYAGFRTESPSFNRRAESPLLSMSLSGSLLSRRCSGQSLKSPTTPTIFEGVSATLDESLRKRPFHPFPINEISGFESINRREISNTTFTTFCSLSDCDASDAMASPKHDHTKVLSSTKERQSVCSLLSMSSLCGIDIVHETSSGAEAIDKFPALLPSGSSEFSANMFKPMRSELSMNSLGLSVDSADVGMDQRDLFTPPVVGMAALNSKQMLSPPPLRCRATSPLNTYHRRSS